MGYNIAQRPLEYAYHHRVSLCPPRHPVPPAGLLGLQLFDGVLQPGSVVVEGLVFGLQRAHSFFQVGPFCVFGDLRDHLRHFLIKKLSDHLKRRGDSLGH